MHHLPKLTLAAILALFVTKAFALNEECNAVLMNDLMNKIIVNKTESSSERELFRQKLFSLEEEQAFEAYKNAYRSAMAQSTSAGLEVQWTVVGAGAEFAHGYQRELTRDEFREAYLKGKKVYESEASRMKSSDNALVSSYASYIRDPNSINAWKDCMTREAPPGIYAFGSRDESGTPFINVLWVAGPFAGDNPSIEVTFEKQGDIKIATGRPKVEVGLGSGESFLVQTKNPNVGFMVQVNGRRMKGDKVLNSFTAKVEIPSFPPPSPKLIAFPYPAEPPICEKARDARARLHPSAPDLEAQCNIAKGKPVEPLICQKAESARLAGSSDAPKLAGECIGIANKPGGPPIRAVGRGKPPDKIAEPSSADSDSPETICKKARDARDINDASAPALEAKCNAWKGLPVEPLICQTAQSACMRGNPVAPALAAQCVVVKKQQG